MVFAAIKVDVYPITLMSMDKDNYINCLEMSEKECYEAMMRKAYGDNFPKDAYEFPAGAIFTPCNEDEADYTIDFLEDPYDNEISDLPQFCPAYARQIEEPKVNRNTFSHIQELADDNGLFETALKNFLEALVILKEYAKESKNFRRWFCVQWGIDENMDFDAILPAIPSSGEMAFATVDADLDVDSYYNREGELNIKVKHHGLERIERFPDKAFDWVRGRAILRCLGNLLLMEEPSLKGKHLYYHIVDENVPDRLVNFEWDDNDINVTEEIQLIPMYNDYIKQLISFEIDRQHIASKNENFIDLNKIRLDKMIDKSSQVPKTVKSELEILAKDPLSFWSDTQEGMDIIETVVKKLPVTPIKSPGEIDIKTDIRKFVDKVAKNLIDTDTIKHYNHMDIRMMLLSKKYPDDIVNAVLSPQLIEGLYYHQNKYHKDDISIYKPFHRSLMYFKIPDKILHKGDFHKLVEQARKDRKVRRQAVKVAYNYLVDAYGVRYRLNNIDVMVFSEMRKKRSVHAGMEVFVRLRRNYWAKHFREQSEKFKKLYLDSDRKIIHYRNERIKYQITAKIFRLVKVKNKYAHKSKFAAEYPRIKTCDVIRDAADHYKQKMKTFYYIRTKMKEKHHMTDEDLNKFLAEKELPPYAGRSVKNYARVIDELMKWEPKMEHIFDFAVEQGKFIVEDVTHIFDKLEWELIEDDTVEKLFHKEVKTLKDVVLEEAKKITPIISPVNSPREKFEVPITAKPVDLLSMFGDEEDEEEDVLPVPTKIPEKAPEPAHVQLLLGFDEDDDFENTPIIQNPGLLVNDIVRDLNVTFHDIVVEKMINDYGPRVTFDKVTMVKNAARAYSRELMVAQFSNKPIVNQEKDFDI